MKKLVITALSGIAFAGMILMSFGTSPASANEVKSLRGGLEIPAGQEAPDIRKLDVVDKFERTFKEQPPLIPHKSAKYKVTLKSNKCLSCHDKSTYKEEEAPMAGKSHYLDASGKEMKTLNMGRYFCSQCHVQQLIVEPLVKNTFVGSK